MGQFVLKFMCRDGTQAQLLFQVADINKPLASVSHLTDIGYCVVFNKIGGRDVSYLLHKETGQYIKMRREKGVYVIDAFMNDLISPAKPAEDAASGFSRRG